MAHRALAALLTLIPAAALDAESEPASSVPLKVVSAAPLDDNLLERIDFELDSLFRGSIDWTLVSEGPETGIAVVLAPLPDAPVVTGCRRGLHDHRLGVAHPRLRRITVWTDQIRRAAAGNWDSPSPPDVSEEIFARALGRVLAHELGHVLLGLAEHRRNGLMRRSLARRQLVAPGRHFRFDEEELRRLREAALPLAASDQDGG